MKSKKKPNTRASPQKPKSNPITESSADNNQRSRRLSTRLSLTNSTNTTCLINRTALRRQSLANLNESVSTKKRISIGKPSKKQSDSSRSSSTSSSASSDKSSLSNIPSNEDIDSEISHTESGDSFVSANDSDSILSHTSLRRNKNKQSKQQATISNFRVSSRQRSCTAKINEEDNFSDDDDDEEQDHDNDSNSSFESNDNTIKDKKGVLKDLYDAEEDSNHSKINKSDEEETAPNDLETDKTEKIDRRTLKSTNNPRNSRRRRRRGRKSLFANQRYVNRQKMLANSTNLSKGGNNNSLLNNTVLNNNVNNSFSAQLVMLNQQAGCEKAPKYVEINYAFKPVIINTFEKGYLIFNYSQDKLEILNNADITSNNAAAIAAANTLDQINKNQQQVLSLLPKVNIQIMQDYPSCYSEYSSPANFVKFNEKTIEELDEEVEYDMDEEDNVWLEIINEKRYDKSLKEEKVISPINQDQFEMVMDRLEKESYFQQTTSVTTKSTEAKDEGSGHGSNKTTPNNTPSKLNLTNNDSISNEDALCCICLDGECLNSNAILFCDMCNLPVHQECYGVPYIPEGQWLCRRCILSPSNPVSCVLCPNGHGAFKQTDRGQWAHVICAIWIPEVHFANTVFLEPIIGLENIDRARWKLTCYICRKKNAGACIQCDKQNCYTAFHVTCAQQAGLYMNIREEYHTGNHQEDESAPDSKTDGRKKGPGRGRKSNHEKKAQQEQNEVEVKKSAFCDLHTPLDVLSPRTKKAVCGSNNSDIDITSFDNAETYTNREEAMKQAQKMRMKRARKILAERRNLPPTICLPVIPKERIDEIKSKLSDSVEDKNEFFEKLVSYWLMKRYSRNGVPLLRRLQHSTNLKKNNTNHKSQHASQNQSNNGDNKTDSPNQTDFIKMRENLSYFKRLRQDLEKARLLMELIRKRERMKLDQIKIYQVETYYEMNAFNGVFLQRLLSILCELDKNKFFLNPVDAIEVPSYYEEIKEPMDFQKMQSKINKLEYKNLNQFEYDFNLIVKNCCQFNQKSSIYHKAATKFKEQGSNVLKQAKKIYETASFMDTDDKI